MSDLIERQDAIDAINQYRQIVDGLYIGLTDTDSVLSKIRGLPSAQQNRIARETAGKSPDEIYDFLYWLMSDYAMQFMDSRAAVIEWLKEERRKDG